jgi:phosphate transport system substrate-binding protein
MNYKIVIPIIVIVILAGGVFGYMELRPATGTVKEASTLTGAGGTLINPLMSAWTSAFYAVKNVSVNYQSVGSGTGITYITERIVDFGESDAPLKAAQYAALNATLLTIPISASAVVPAYNLPGIGNGLKFTGSVLAQIFDGNITMWNDPQIAALNPGVSLPNHQIIVVHRSDGSGTMFAFTDYLSDSSSYWKNNVGKGTSVNWPLVGPNGQQMAVIGEKGNEGVAGYILSNSYTIGPLEIAYEIVNKNYIAYGSVQNAAGNYILANVTNVGAAITAAAISLPAGNAQWTNVSIIDSIYSNTVATNAYPITTFTYLLVYQQQSDKAIGLAVVDFAWWIVNSGQTVPAVTTLGYVPLPSNVVTSDDNTINSITYNGIQLHTGS